MDLLYKDREEEEKPQSFHAFLSLEKWKWGRVKNGLSM